MGNEKGSYKFLDRKAIAIGATGTSLTFKIYAPGIVVTRYILECYNGTNAVTRTLSFVDANSITVFTGSAHNENANYSVPIDLELEGTYTVTITLSGVAGGTGGTDYLTLFAR